MKYKLRKYIGEVFENWGKRLKEVPRIKTAERKILYLPNWVVILFLFVSFYWLFLVELGFDKAVGIFISLLFFMFLNIYIANIYFNDFKNSPEKVSFIGTVVIFTLLLMEFVKYNKFSCYIIPIPFAAIFVNVLVGTSPAILVSTSLSIVYGVIFGFNFELFIITYFISLVSIIASLKVDHRRHLVTTGFIVAAAEIVLLFVFVFLKDKSPAEFLKIIFYSFITGISSSILVLGLLPFPESIFDLVSNIRLIELGDFNQPLLKKLVQEAPGTYHHSLLVASLVENACIRISANPVLARIGAYYHDIGKLYKPSYFIENDFEGGSRHESLEPKMSGLIITGHVKEGIKLAKTYKLPRVIIDFIAQHHGTSLMHYFYIKNIRKSDERKLQDIDFRYLGPKPQTKEVALVMLADSVEAAVRTLDKPTFERIKDIVQKIINNKFIDGQLDECPLTLKDLHSIGDSFIHTLTSIYHSRVEYPEEKSINGKRKK